ncbi:hypothetical protein [Arundinibacter roseus]|uniref:Beta-galactosidase trimerisation domain-containing protein n=1 Tax=Arundinibacter roseus TaxID=2070510 RepID=A0A4R4KL55_9BACT|nr:hypothetical protein [Arundinibacter roseus]TDB67429.1 hypothetical protein EZE20_05645 [Arundinibacter roseus]
MQTSRVKILFIVFFLAHSCGLVPQHARAQSIASSLKGQNFNSITLEASLKPFRKNDKTYIRQVAREMFVQWHSLLRHTDTVSVMLWTSDGSEILDYKGTMKQPLEWAKYLGNPNTKYEVGSGPEELSIHERAYLYMENPPAFTYGDLNFIIQTLKEEGKKVTGKPILIGATFDPGPEFAKSEFKYKKHPEILGGSAMGHKSFVSCYSVLNADTESYAGFPKGIPANTPFGTFFGRQSEHFLRDLGYDFIWFSNGFGFGAEGWSATGATFTGKEFQQDRLSGLTAKINEFWQLFRKECPDFQIQTRGTNLSVGADLARDAVNLKQIYEGGFNMLPPPNSPWAALDGDFGLEMVGYMSRMSELPDHRFLFRYYTHDPWWLNSPWLDRYGREPHDIYLPMSVSRLDARGTIGIPTHLNFLTIDNSLGEMPTQVPDEVTPHILKARYDAPTAPGPLVWVYPFDEYHQWAYDDKERLPQVYYGDWFIRQAINNGLPLNTVISTTSFQAAIAGKPDLFKESTLLTIAPDAGSTLESALINFVQKGGKLIIFGPTDHCGPAFLEFINQKNDVPLEGEFNVSTSMSTDQLEEPYPAKINHRSLFNGGGVRSVLKDRQDSYTRLLAEMQQGTHRRDAAWIRNKPEWKGGKVAYVRGTNTSSFTGGRLLTPDTTKTYFEGSLLLRYLLPEFGLTHRIEKRDPSIKNPVLTVARSNNAFVFSGYNPNSTVRQHFRFEQGAPLLLGLETRLVEGHSSYTMPTAWNRECRVFVEQNDGIISFKELHSGQRGINKRYSVGGLKNATVRIYAEEQVSPSQFHAYGNASYPWKTGQVPFRRVSDHLGNYFVVEKITGELVVSW